MRRGRNGFASRSADARPTVLLTDGEERSVLAAARGLAAASYRVACAASSRSAATHWSRACDEQLLLPDVRSGVTEFVSSLEAVLDAGDYRVTIPGTDAALLVASASRARLERVTTIGLPSPEAVTAALDNLALLEGAAAAGVETPESVVCRSLDEALEAAAELGLPTIVKARSSVTREGDRITHHRTMLVADVAGLADAVRAAGFPCVVQGREDEPRLLSLAGVAGDDGGLLAVAASRYLRTWPLQAGAAAFSETVAPPAGLVDAAGTLLEALGWRGIFELEFLETRDGRTLLIDLNPRVYGSLALAVAAGINLPAIWCGYLLGERSTGLVLTARAGVRYRWEDADARNLLHFLRSGQLRAAVALARPKRNVTHAFGRLDDPAPLAARALEPLARRLRSRRASTSTVPTSRRRIPPRPMSGACDAAVIGAGPQGLAAVAHLRAHGVDTRMFGNPMEFWHRHMPSGMLLRSSWRASHIADPDRALTLDAFQETLDRPIPDPIPLDAFIAYGGWFQRRVAPDVDPRMVIGVGQVDGGFRVRLEDGEEVLARRVIVAVGARAFVSRPEQFASVSPELVSHAADHHDLAYFAGSHVVVLGRGQSAVESAALLEEAGATVELAFRADALNWLPEQPHEPRGAAALVAAARYAPTDVGPFGLNWIAAAPDVYARLPRGVRRDILARATAPAAAAWLRRRVGNVVVLPGKLPVQVTPNGKRVELRFDDGSRRTADHVLLGTGYRVDLARYSFLADELRSEIATEDGFPRLSYGLESSVPGLHFLGFAAAASFGPVMRFVVGAEYAARSLLRRVLGKPPSVLDFSW